MLKSFIPPACCSGYLQTSSAHSSNTAVHHGYLVSLVKMCVFIPCFNCPHSQGWRWAQSSLSRWSWTVRLMRRSPEGRWCPARWCWSSGGTPECTPWRCREEGWPQHTGWRTAAWTRSITTTPPRSRTSGRDSIWSEVSSESCRWC